MAACEASFQLLYGWHRGISGVAHYLALGLPTLSLVGGHFSPRRLTFEACS